MSPAKYILLLCLISYTVAYQIKTSKSVILKPFMHKNQKCLNFIDDKFEYNIVFHENNDAGYTDSLAKKSSINMSGLLIFTMFYSPWMVLADNDDNTLTIITIVRPIFDVFVNTLSLFFLCRTIFSWYPKTDLTKLPYSIAVWPTEPLLKAVRSFIPPAFGVDISAIVWLMVLSFLREILTGQQGILTLLERS